MSRTRLYLLHGKFASSRQLFLAFVFILRVYLVGEGGGGGGRKKNKKARQRVYQTNLDRIYAVFVNMRVY